MRAVEGGIQGARIEREGVCKANLAAETALTVRKSNDCQPSMAPTIREYEKTLLVRQCQPIADGRTHNASAHKLHSRKQKTRFFARAEMTVKSLLVLLCTCSLTRKSCESPSPQPWKPRPTAKHDHARRQDRRLIIAYQKPHGCSFRNYRHKITIERTYIQHGSNTAGSYPTPKNETTPTCGHAPALQGNLPQEGSSTTRSAIVRAQLSLAGG